MADRIAALGNGEQYGGVFECFERVQGVGHDEEIAWGAVPGDLTGGEPNTSLQHVHSGLAWVLVVIQPFARRQRDDGLAQHVFVAAEHSVRAPSTGGTAGQLQLFTGEGGQ